MHSSLNPTVSLRLLHFIYLLVASTQGAEVASPEEQERGNFGYRVLAISDLTGDGVPDLAVSALHNGDARGPRGAVFVLNGEDFSLISRCEAPYPPTDRVADQGSFGWSLAQGRDVNGDGTPEIVVGAVYDDRPDLADLLRQSLSCRSEDRYDPPNAFRSSVAKRDLLRH
jgi:hypothetical protein